MTTRPCPTCGTSGKDKDGHRCLECGGAGHAPPDFANRFTLKIALASIESTLCNQINAHLPSPRDLDEHDVEALNKLLVQIRDHVNLIHDRLIPPKKRSHKTIGACAHCKHVGMAITDEPCTSCSRHIGVEPFNFERKPVNVAPCPHCKGESARTHTACPDCRGHGFIEILP